MPADHRLQGEIDLIHAACDVLSHRRGHVRCRRVGPPVFGVQRIPPAHPDHQGPKEQEHVRQ